MKKTIFILMIFIIMSSCVSQKKYKTVLNKNQALEININEKKMKIQILKNEVHDLEEIIRTGKYDK